MAERFSAVDHLIETATAPAQRAPLAEHLEKISSDLTERNSRVVRALSILAAHPDFEKILANRDFLELQDILAKERLLP